MSDITIHLEGLMATLVFMLLIALLIPVSLITALLAFFASRKSGEKVSRQVAYGFFITTVPLILLNLIFFGLMYFVIDKASHDFNEILDNLAMYFWLPFQPIAIVAGGLIYRRRLKN